MPSKISKIQLNGVNYEIQDSEAVKLLSQGNQNEIVILSDNDNKIISSGTTLEDIFSRVDVATIVDNVNDGNWVINIFNSDGSIDLSAYYTQEQIDSRIASAMESVRIVFTEDQVAALGSGITAQKLETLEAHTADNSIHVTSSEKSDWNSHIVNNDIHVSSTDKTEWNNHINNTSMHVNSSDKNVWNSHVDNVGIHVTAEDKITWDAKQNALVAGTDYVTPDDPRLSDARTPTAHTHTTSSITNFDSIVDSKINTARQNFIEGVLDLRLSQVYSAIDRLPSFDMIVVPTGNTLPVFKEYDPSIQYFRNEQCKHDGSVYSCVSPTTINSPWDAGKWRSDDKIYLLSDAQYTLQTEVPDDWDTNWRAYYTITYTQVTSQPTDWRVNWKNYYKKSNNTYSKFTGDTAPGWTSNCYIGTYSLLSGSLPVWQSDTYYSLNVTPGNLYQEYLFANDNWELIGSASIDLDNLAGKAVEIYDASSSNLALYNGTQILQMLSEGKTLTFQGHPVIYSSATENENEVIVAYVDKNDGDIGFVQKIIAHSSYTPVEYSVASGDANFPTGYYTQTAEGEYVPAQGAALSSEQYYIETDKGVQTVEDTEEPSFVLDDVISLISDEGLSDGVTVDMSRYTDTSIISTPGANPVIYATSATSYTPVDFETASNDPNFPTGYYVQESEGAYTAASGSASNTEEYYVETAEVDRCVVYLDDEQKIHDVYYGYADTVYTPVAYATVSADANYPSGYYTLDGSLGYIPATGAVSSSAQYYTIDTNNTNVYLLLM